MLMEAAPHDQLRMSGGQLQVASLLCTETRADVVWQVKCLLEAPSHTPGASCALSLHGCLRLSHVMLPPGGRTLPQTYTR